MIKHNESRPIYQTPIVLRLDQVVAGPALGDHLPGSSCAEGNRAFGGCHTGYSPNTAGVGPVKCDVGYEGSDSWNPACMAGGTPSNCKSGGTHYTKP